MKVFSIKYSLLIDVFTRYLWNAILCLSVCPFRRLIHPFVVARMNISTPFRTNCREFMYWRVLTNFVRNCSTCLKSNNVTFYKKIYTVHLQLFWLQPLIFLMVIMFTNVFMVTVVAVVTQFKTVHTIVFVTQKRREIFVCTVHQW